ncbi:MAG: hypothetical protein K9L74_07175 [Candidatus Izimaplasma sp.]|nr:hypothetical protein [Candidatus Izimaplasma bacterium]
MKAIIYFTSTKKHISEKVANQYEGDVFKLEDVKSRPKNFLLQLLIYGYITVRGKEINYKPLTLDIDQYDHIVLISPIWAGKITPFMQSFIKDYKIKNKDLSLIVTCGSENEDYLNEFRSLIDDSNTIIEERQYKASDLD